MGSNTLGVALMNDLNNEGLRNMEIEGFTMELGGQGEEIIRFEDKGRYEKKKVGYEELLS